MIIDWTKIAKNIYKEIKKEVDKLEKKPTLKVILVWNNSASLRYVAQKQKFADIVWINFELITFKKNIEEKELLNKIKELNYDGKTNGFIVQLPLPEHITTDKVIDLINPEKDVDWFTKQNIWALLIWLEKSLVPCTPKWIMEILSYENIDLKWKNVVVIWRSNIVWKPVSWLLINAWATVSVCNSSTKDLEDYTKKADIIVIATWKPKMLKKEMLWKNTIIIDVWFSVVDWKIYGDADFENIEKNHKITPVPWWVWPLTVAMLMKNTLQAYKNQNEI